MSNFDLNACFLLRPSRIVSVVYSLGLMYCCCEFKAVAKEDTLLLIGFLAGQTSGKQNKCFVSMLCKPGNICCRHKCF